jgi:predicted nucleic acid-binding protein
MITALDSSVILDILIDDPKHAPATEIALNQARQEGPLIVCETVLAEIVPLLRDDEVDAFLAAWDIAFTPTSKESALLAGSLFRSYLKRGGQRKLVLADFLVGSHARCFAGRLLTRHRTYYRDCFQDLVIWTP